MAGRLLDAGTPLTLWNRTAQRGDDLVARGAARAGTPADAVRDAEIVVTMVSDPAALMEVLDGPRGVLSALRGGNLLIDASTVGPDAARDAAARCRARDAGYVDPPVLGSVPAAEQGTLTVLAGGSEGDVDRALPLLEQFGKTIIRTGEVGSASTLKLVMNLLVGGQTELMAEAFLLAERAGLAKHLVRDAITGSVLNSPFVGYKAPQLLDRSFTPLFTNALLLKDIDLALDLARAHELELPGVRAIRDAYAAASAAGRTGDDFSAVIATLDVERRRAVDHGPVTYEVSAEVAPALTERYETFMRTEHLREIVRTGCFLHGRLDRVSETAYRAAYLAASHSDVERYLTRFAPAMRDRFSSEFPTGITLTRTIWTERGRWP
ncbi:MAG: 3-hydroxyisobutyrate dehydrogenase [Gemmatimonadetes bacterium]|nr:3-hydroxyisobutyrate dehydrogenase [Gemmatimonadota bacterium]